MHQYRLQWSEGNYEVELVAVPWWAVAVSRGVSSADAACGHRLCGEGSPEWVWHLPLGWPAYDEDHFLTNSLGSYQYRLFGQLLCLDIYLSRPIGRFSVPYEVALTLGAVQFDEEDE